MRRVAFIWQRISDSSSFVSLELMVGSAQAGTAPDILVELVTDIDGKRCNAACLPLLVHAAAVSLADGHLRWAGEAA